MHYLYVIHNIYFSQDKMHTQKQRSDIIKNTFSSDFLFISLVETFQFNNKFEVYNILNISAFITFIYL